MTVFGICVCNDERVALGSSPQRGQYEFPRGALELVTLVKARCAN